VTLCSNGRYVRELVAREIPVRLATYWKVLIAWLGKITGFGSGVRREPNDLVERTVFWQERKWLPGLR